MGYWEYKSRNGATWEMGDDPELMLRSMFSDGFFFKEGEEDVSAKSPFGVWMMTDGTEQVMRYAIKYLEMENPDLECEPFIKWLMANDVAPVVGYDYVHNGETVAEWIDEDDGE